MRMDPHDILALRETLPVFTDRPAEVAEFFYARLFEIGPELRPLFPDDLSDLGRKLTSTMSLTITTIEDWDALAPILAALARRHVAYGVEPWHYSFVTQAFCATLKHFGATPFQMAAWRRALSLIAGHMIDAAYALNVPVGADGGTILPTAAHADRDGA